MKFPMWCRLLFISLLLCTVFCDLASEEQLQFNVVRNWFTTPGDPKLETDAFSKLPDRVKSILEGKVKWDLYYMKERLSAIEMPVRIDVVLVGFDGDGAYEVRINNNELIVHFSALHTEFKIYSISDWNEEEGIIVKIAYGVVRAQESLIKEIEKVIDRKRMSSKTQGTLSVPYEEIDNLILKDCRQFRRNPAIYILNPKKAKDLTYVYEYPQSESCPGNFWISSHQSGKQYQWTDLSAGPLKFGPMHAGVGQVTWHTFPRLDFYPARVVSQAIIPDLASMVNSVLQHLFLPSAWNLNLPTWEQLQIQVIHIYDALIPDSNMTTGFDPLQTQLDLLKLPGQSIEMHHYHVTLGGCDQCMAAYSQSMKIKTKRVPGPGLEIIEMPVLDSANIHSWFADEHFQRFLRDNRYTSIPLRSSSSTKKILPVFIFEISGLESIMLDEVKTAVSYPDMVIALRTHIGSVLSGMSCSGHEIEESTVEITRQVLAALLQTGWGVLPTGQKWTAGNELVQDYRWSLGNTPFEIFSTSSELSESLISTCKRNYILSIVSQTRKNLQTLYDSFLRLSPPGFITDLLPKEVLSEFYTRANLLQAKLSVSLACLGKSEFDQAQSFALSAEFDLKALTRILNGLDSYGVKSVLICPHARGRVNFLIVLGIGAIIGLVLWSLYRMKPVKSKPY